MLSLAVDDLSLLVRSDGPIGDDVIIRTMDLLDPAGARGGALSDMMQTDG